MHKFPPETAGVSLRGQMMLGISMKLIDVTEHEFYATRGETRCKADDIHV